MSEYQYYEFQAIDRALSEKEMAELRAYSTRARITPTSFVNDYAWGDVKGNADAWMEKYFDAFLYLANWGTHRLKLRLPARLPVLIFDRGRFVVRPGLWLFHEVKPAHGKIEREFQRHPREGADEDHVNPLARNHAGAVLRGEHQVALGEQLRRRQQSERFADARLMVLVEFRGRSVRGTKFDSEVRCSEVR